jgi:hypothetical protein
MRVQGSRLFQKLRAVHLRHLLIDQQERYWFVAQAHLFQLIQHVTWNRPIASPSVLFHVRIASGVGDSSTGHCLRLK